MHDLLIEARSWLGVPYLHQGRSRSGIDCIGLVIEVLRKCGRLPAEFDERLNYGPVPTRDELAERVRYYCTRLADPEPGCMLTMRWNQQAAHVALYTGETIIHAHTRLRGGGRVVEIGYRGHWPRLTDAAWRLP